MNLKDTAAMVGAVNLEKAGNPQRISDLIEDLSIDSEELRQHLDSWTQGFIDGDGIPPGMPTKTILMAFGIYMFLIGSYHEKLRDK